MSPLTPPLFTLHGHKSACIVEASPLNTSIFAHGYLIYVATFAVEILVAVHDSVTAISTPRDRYSYRRDERYLLLSAELWQLAGRQTSGCCAPSLHIVKAFRSSSAMSITVFAFGIQRPSTPHILTTENNVGSTTFSPCGVAL